MQLHFSVTFACCGKVEILVSTWCEAEVVQILKMILGKNYWCADSPGLQVCKSASLQVCKSASLQICKSADLQACKSASLQSASVAHRYLYWQEHISTAMQGTIVMLIKKKPFFKMLQLQSTHKIYMMKLIPHLHLQAGCEHLGQHHGPNTRKKPTLQKSWITTLSNLL